MVRLSARLGPSALGFMVVNEATASAAPRCALFLRRFGVRQLFEQIQQAPTQLAELPGFEGVSGTFEHLNGVFECLTQLSGFFGRH